MGTSRFEWDKVNQGCGLPELNIRLRQVRATPGTANQYIPARRLKMNMISEILAGRLEKREIRNSLSVQDLDSRHFRSGSVFEWRS